MKRQLRLGCVVALFSILLLPTAASEPPTSSPSVTLIRCGMLIDGVSAVLRKNVLLRIEGNRIVSLSKNRHVSLHEGATTIDLSNATCLPGLIDVHVHLIVQDPQRGELRTPPKSLSAENLLRTLRYGFTTVRNLGTVGLGPTDIDVRNAAAKGTLPGPRLKVAICDIQARNFGTKGPTELRDAVDRIADEGSDWLKLFDAVGPASPGVADSKREIQYTKQELSAFVDEAHNKA